MLRNKLYPYFPTVYQNVNKTKSRALGLFMDSVTFLWDNYRCSFSFLGQDMIMPRSNYAIIAGNWSEKHNLAPFHTYGRSKTSTF